eukprot:1158518-Pelagomonas_calceolata.AAC.4
MHWNGMGFVRPATTVCATCEKTIHACGSYYKVPLIQPGQAWTENTSVLRLMARLTEPKCCTIPPYVPLTPIQCDHCPTHTQSAPPQPIFMALQSLFFCTSFGFGMA